MNHFDYPMGVLKTTGGWADKRIVSAFTDYADFLFRTFGDRVIAAAIISKTEFDISIGPD